MHYPMFDARDAQGEQEREGCSRHERGHERLLLQEAPPPNFAVSQHVSDEAADGDVEFAKLRTASIQAATAIDGLTSEVKRVAGELLSNHAVPDKEITDAFHIATASVHGMDVLLTWNCRHMANPVTLPKTAMLIGKAGYMCPIIITPQEFLERKEEFNHEN